MILQWFKVAEHCTLQEQYLADVKECFDRVLNFVEGVVSLHLIETLSDTDRAVIKDSFYNHSLNAAARLDADRDEYRVSCLSFQFLDPYAHQADLRASLHEKVVRLLLATVMTDSLGPFGDYESLAWTFPRGLAGLPSGPRLMKIPSARSSVKCWLSAITTQTSGNVSGKKKPPKPKRCRWLLHRSLRVVDNDISLWMGLCTADMYLIPLPCILQPYTTDYERAYRRDWGVAKRRKSAASVRPPSGPHSPAAISSQH